MEKPILIGEGSYGKVYRHSQNLLYKELKLWIHDKTHSDNFIFIENNFKELIFYNLILLFYKEHYSNFTISFLLNVKFSHILIPDKIEVEGSVAKIFFEHRGTILNDIKFINFKQFFTIFKQLSQAIYELFDCNITHGDLKPTNILVDDKENVTLIDFGSVCLFHNINITNSYQRCTLVYVSPEELIEQKYSIANDWWGIGVIMFEFLTEKSFIPSLMVFYKLSNKMVQNFIDDVFYNKKKDDFNSKMYLTNFLKKLKQKHIDYFINSYIDSTTIKKVSPSFTNEQLVECKTLLTSLLTLDKIERINNKQKIIKYFNLELIANECDNQSTNDLEHFKNLVIPHYSIELRKGFVDIIYYLCYSTKIKKFSQEVFAHSIMLLDRFFVKLDINTLQESINYPVICVLCVCLSSIVLKGEYFKSKEIVSIVEHLFEQKIEHTKIEATLIFFLKQMNLSIFNLSPDLLINSSINYKKVNQILKEYIVVNENSLALYELLTME